jgi:pimeloyl-ACP methyl ester carboxylesterase
VRCFLPSDQDKVIEKEIIPVIEQTAYERGLDIINLHNLFGDKWVESLMPDKLHPSSIGVSKLVQKLYQYLTINASPSDDIIESFKLKPIREFNFHGYKGYEYDNNGVKYYIVKPHHAAVGKPWIWRARFWGHEPQVDIEMLEQGFHLTYCDVAELFGSETAVERWDEFYSLATKAGLSKKVVLEGMSRGGLIIYNWAAQNTDKVACIYGDAPVMDIKSWPMNWGDCLDENRRTMELMFKAYNFNGVEDAMAWKKNPIDHARKLAKAKIPMIHVVGDIDEGVPVAENTAVFEQRVAKYGHSVHVIHKPEVGHHPHSLNNPEPIIRFILNATGYKVCSEKIPEIIE